MPERPGLREEFRQWWQSAPRVWVIIGAIVLGAVIFRDLLGLIALIVFVLFVLSIIPAIAGALAGKAVGHVIRRIRYPQDAKFARQVPLILPRKSKR